MIDTTTIRELAQIMRENGLSRLDISHSDGRILLEKSGTDRLHSQPDPTQSEAFAPTRSDVPAAASESGTYVKAPLVGTVYLAPSPDEEPFVKVGDSVKAGDVLCTVEAMKMFNEITAPHDGVVKSIEVKNGQSAGYGDKLFVIERQ